MDHRPRFLHFDNVDLHSGCIFSRCSACGEEFSSEPEAEEWLNEVLARVRSAFDAHECAMNGSHWHGINGSVETAHSGTPIRP